MALTADREVNRFIDQLIRSYPVGGGETIYKSSFVSSDASGYAAPLAAGELFIGLAFEGKDNAAGADGDLSVRVFSLGDFHHALSGATITSIGSAVYATDDGTLSFTSTSNSYVGICIDVPAAGEIILRLDSCQSAAQ